MNEHRITLNHPNQIEISFDEGTVTIHTEADTFVIDFGDDSFAFALIGAVANAREWKANAERARMERDLDTDWFAHAKQILGGGQ